MNSVFENPYVSGEKSILPKLIEKHFAKQPDRCKHSKCPICGYHAFNGEECFDCGYRP